MPNPIVRLVAKEMECFQVFRQENPLIFPNQDNLYPVPFFGDIRKAEVLTLALNPAWTEFRKGGHHERYWIPGLDACALTTRLLHYFDLPVPTPHRFFEDLRPGLAVLGKSYGRNVAHIDLHSFPTKFRNALGDSQREVIGGYIETTTREHLQEILKLAPKVTLILVVDFLFTRPNGDAIGTFEFVASEQSGLQNCINDHGSQPPIFRAGGPDQFAARIQHRADALRQYLCNPSPLRLCPFSPLR